MSLWTWTATFLCSSPACRPTLQILVWPTSKTAWAKSWKINLSLPFLFSSSLLFFLLPLPVLLLLLPLTVLLSPPFLLLSKKIGRQTDTSSLFCLSGEAQLIRGGERIIKWREENSVLRTREESKGSWFTAVCCSELLSCHLQGLLWGRQHTLVSYFCSLLLPPSLSTMLGTEKTLSRYLLNEQIVY